MARSQFPKYPFNRFTSPFSSQRRIKRKPNIVTTLMNGTRIFTIPVDRLCPLMKVDSSDYDLSRSPLSFIFISSAEKEDGKK